MSDVRVCRAALVLGGLLLVLMVRAPASGPAPRCAAPRALPASGPLVRVACDEIAPGNVGVEAPAALPAGLLFGRALDLNAASEASLAVLPGVGPNRAHAIAAARAGAPFATVDDLRRVHGIGPRTVAGLRGWAGVGAPATAAARAPAAPAR